ncbi:MAG: hypothetical protein FJY91_01065 [Candidatus Harrisonbacteria bacterium]|nr:hypothetical protein [Candidatus Harrisonbacteria bacterium]
MSNKTVLIIGVIFLLLVGGLIGYQKYTESLPDKLDSFAQCLGEKGAKFYGAFWCPHCQDQKKVFGRSAKYLPYVECSTADGRGKLQVCLDERVDGYPTWKFADGTAVSGLASTEILAQKTDCTLPQ